MEEVSPHKTSLSINYQNNGRPNVINVKNDPPSHK